MARIRELRQHRSLTLAEALQRPANGISTRQRAYSTSTPTAGTDLTSANIEVAGIETIIQFNGTSTAPVQWINLDSFHYTGTSRTFAKCNETILRSDWQIYRGASLFIVGAEDTTIANSFFDNVGGNAVFVSGYNRRVSVAHNKFIGTGASAILFMGLSSAVGHPL